MRKSIFLILNPAFLLIIPLIAFAANEVNLDADTNFLLLTTDTATATTIIGLSGGVTTNLAAEINYLDITMENDSAIIFDSNSNFTFTASKQSGADSYTATKSCPTSNKSRITLSATDNVVLRLRIASTQASCEEEEPSGGGGLSSGAASPPAAPPAGFKVVINDDAEKTDSRKVTLTLNGGPDTKRMAISNFSDFRYAGQEPYLATRTWTLAGAEGIKAVYAKFYTSWGQPSEVVSDTIILIAPPVPPPPLSPEAKKVDANDDERIDILDFNILMINWGSTATGNIADFNKDNKVDVFDFNLLIISWTLY